MSNVGQVERKAQERIVKLLREQMGYKYAGHWETRVGNANIEVAFLEANLASRGYSASAISKAIAILKSDASLGGGRDLMQANREVYGLLRYGVDVKTEAGEITEKVALVDWKHPELNDFHVAEEVTISALHTKRPDLVLYVNGIALVTIELKRSKIAVSEGIRQSIGNQDKAFIRPFFTTVQLLFAGNDVEGLRYAPIDTPERYWLSWREPSDIEEPLDRAISQLCRKERLLEIVRDFMVFDLGVKKTCRHNQYFGVKASQARVLKREGGILWHTQGSGKSLTMVWLAKWLKERGARVLIITDRTELDKQISDVFAGVDEAVYRTKSGADLLNKLNTLDEWLICSLVHKFRGSDSDRDSDEATSDFLKELRSSLPKDFSAKGDIFVFVDEAHRTQSGKMHDAMKELLPNAIFLGFTGTPLLKVERATSIETFGSFIHTYKFDEAVADGVVLDLRYEARNIDQDLTSQKKIDLWFDAKTKGMTDLSKAELKKRWGTVQKVTSSEPRSKQIVDDILFDMETRPRLSDGRGNAMLVGSSIYQACKLYELFVQAGFKGKCAIVTSYAPQAGDVSKEDSGAGATEKLRQYEIYRQMLADHFSEPADVAMTKVEKFEEQVKDAFIKHPGQMRLLIVVDKLLTGFDAPPATYLYIDKTMQDHGLFQAICRVNRLDGDDKEYGYIVDYQDLFKSLKTAITDYTSGALDGYEKKDIEGLLSDRLEKAKEHLDAALETIRAVCEPVEPPKNTLQYQQYFCTKVEADATQLKANEPKRVDLYKAIAAVTRAYGAIANEMNAAGYSDAEAVAIKKEIEHYANVRQEVKLGAGEDVDFKQYEAGMRHLLDTYISAKPSEVISDFEDAGLIDLIVKLGAGALDKLPAGLRKSPEAAAETIANNVRRLIVDEYAVNPKYYEKMSELLDDILKRKREQGLEYQQYLAELLDLAGKVGKRESDTKYPEWATTHAIKALVDFFGENPNMALEMDTAIKLNKHEAWVGHNMREKALKTALRKKAPDLANFDEFFDLVKAQVEYQ